MPDAQAHPRYVVNGPGLPTAGIWACSPAVVSGGTCYVSGQPPYDFASNTLVGDTVGAQFDLAFSHVLAILRAAGYSRDDLVSVTVLLTDLRDYDEMNNHYLARFEGAPGLPARLTFAVHQLLDDAKVELHAVAHKGE